MTMEATHLDFLRTFLLNLNDASVDWAEIALARGIKRKDNAQTSFKGIMKRYGLEYKDNKFKPIEGFTPEDGAAKATKKTPTPRKRKAKDEDKAGMQIKDESPSKKSKVKKEAKVDEESSEDTM